MKARPACSIAIAMFVALAAAANDVPMTNADAREICEYVAEVESAAIDNPLRVPMEKLPSYSRGSMSDGHDDDTPPRGQLEESFELELGAGAPRRFGHYMGTGTCVMFSIAPFGQPDLPMDAQWPQTTSAAPEAEDELHLIGWGGGESVLAH